jgi:hypothetical protein
MIVVLSVRDHSIFEREVPFQKRIYDGLEVLIIGSVPGDIVL